MNNAAKAGIIFPEQVVAITESKCHEKNGPSKQWPFCHMGETLAKDGGPLIRSLQNVCLKSCMWYGNIS